MFYQIWDTRNFFGKVEPSTCINTEAIVVDRATFYGTLFACTGIASKVETCNAASISPLRSIKEKNGYRGSLKRR